MNYLNMLSQKPEEPFAPEAAPSAPVHDEQAAAVQALMEVIQQASPEFQAAGDFSEYLTSPMDESPWEDFLTTPALGADDLASEFLTSPAIVDADDFGSINGLPLFPEGPMSTSPVDPIKAVPPVPAPPFPTINFDAMYTMPSPNTPSLDPSSLHPSPLVHAVPSLSPSTSSPAPRRKNAPTGTRKGVTPDSLVPYDAPIQTRNYITPSATSRKEVPAVFARKRARTAAFGKEDEDQLDEDGVAPSANDLDAIEAKRRQNTLAARRSRKRKLEYQRELEESIDREREEKEQYRSRCMMLEAYIKSHGLPVP